MGKRTVLQSINQEGGPLCVDIFQRPDGSFGFAEYRRDPEDPRGWYATGQQDHLRFATAEEAVKAAGAVISWLSDTDPA